MDLKYIVPKVADVTAFEGDGGAYYSWSSFSTSPNLLCGKIVLHPRGLAIPHYADTPKVGYVVQGKCTVGFVTPESSEEKVFVIKKGVGIPVPLGTTSWWYNGEDSSDAVIVFLGQSAKAYVPGQFTYFFLGSAVGILKGFSTDFLRNFYGLTKTEAENLATSQNRPIIYKVDQGIKMPVPQEDGDKEAGKLFIDVDNVVPKVNMGAGGSIRVVTAEDFPELKSVGLSIRVLRLGGDYMLGPSFVANSAEQMIYVTKGSGRIQIVGYTGESVLDTKLEAGQLFAVPRVFVHSITSDGGGLECIYVITSSEPAFEDVAGRASVWKALSPPVLQASLGVTAEFVKLFKSKIENGDMIIPLKK